MSKKYRIEPKPERKMRFKAFLETESLDEVKAWIARPTIPTTTRIYGSDGTMHRLVMKSTQDIIVSELRPSASAMDDNDNVPMVWAECKAVDLIARRDTADGCRQIEVWQGKPSGSLTPYA